MIRRWVAGAALVVLAVRVEAQTNYGQKQITNGKVSPNPAVIPYNGSSVLVTLTFDLYSNAYQGACGVTVDWGDRGPVTNYPVGASQLHATIQHIYTAVGRSLVQVRGSGTTACTAAQLIEVFVSKAPPNAQQSAAAGTIGPASMVPGQAAGLAEAKAASEARRQAEAAAAQRAADSIAKGPTRDAQLGALTAAVQAAQRVLEQRDAEYRRAEEQYNQAVAAAASALAAFTRADSLGKACLARPYTSTNMWSAVAHANACDQETGYPAAYASNEAAKAQVVQRLAALNQAKNAVRQATEDVNKARAALAAFH